MALTWNDVVALGSDLPSVAEGVWYRTPSLTVAGKSFVRLKEDSVNVVFLLRSVAEQEDLVATKPAVYHITDHYKGYAAVLARLSKLSARECRERLAIAYRERAPKKILAAHDAEIAGSAPSPPTKPAARKSPPSPKAASKKTATKKATPKKTAPTKAAAKKAAPKKMAAKKAAPKKTAAKRATPKKPARKKRTTAKTATKKATA